MSEVIKGFKVFNPDWTSHNGFQYEVGKTYFCAEKPIPCQVGFHFCQKASDCFAYYQFDPLNKVAEVEAIGDTVTEYDKTVTNAIRIIREVPWTELLSIVNLGLNNYGYNNAGHCNAGCNNTGFGNSGDSNTGSDNKGHRNSGHCNHGNYNTGNGNWGYANSGDFNVGDRNTGMLNTGNYNTGCFNTIEPYVTCFNKPTNFHYSEFINLKGVSLLMDKFDNIEWVRVEVMTDEEKAEHPECKITKGYLSELSFERAMQIMWFKFDDEEKEAIKAIPNFDPDIFKEITGIDVNED